MVKITIKARNMKVLRKVINIADHHHMGLHDLLYPALYGVDKKGLNGKTAHSWFNMRNKKTQRVDVYASKK